MVLAGTGLRAQGTQLDMEVPKTLALMSRVADVGLETVDIAMGRKKMKAAAVMRTAVRETAVDFADSCCEYNNGEPAGGRPSTAGEGLVDRRGITCCDA